MPTDSVFREILTKSPDLPPDAVGWLLDRCGAASLYPGRGPLPEQVGALVKKHGYRMAVTIAHVADDPQVLARLAKHTSVQVRRAVAGNPHTDQSTLEFLWRWVLSAEDGKTLDLLSRALPFEWLLASAEPLQFFDPSADIPAALLKGSGYMFGHAAGGSPPHKAILGRLRRTPTEEPSATRFREVITHRCLLLALKATLMCAPNRAHRLPFSEAVQLFAQTHRDTVAGPSGCPESTHRCLAAACVRMALLDDGTVIDVELAELAVKYRDLIVPAQAPATARSDWTVTRNDRHPAFYRRTSSEAVDVFLDSGVPEYCAAAVLSFDKAQMRRLMGSMLLPREVLNWAARSNAAVLPSELLTETLQAYRKQQLEGGVFVPFILDVLAAADDIPHDLLRWLLRRHPAEVTAAFLAGRFRTVPTAEFVASFVADVKAKPPQSWAWPKVEWMLVEDLSDLVGAPWASDLVDAIPLGALGGSYFGAEYVADRLIEGFGESSQLWTTALNLIDSQFPGTLSELVDMVKAIADGDIEQGDMERPGQLQLRV